MKQRPDRSDDHSSIGDAPLPPEERYALFGSFDFGTYESDLEQFPESFDEEGWPLFGDYDPYALRHPMTGVAWHRAPRTPRDDEEDDDYHLWHEIAVRFDQALHKSVAPTRRALKKIAPAEEDPRWYGYGGSSYKLAPTNLRYLEKILLPRLSELIENRIAGLELVLLWGEFTALTALAPISTKNIQNRQKRSKGGVSHSREAQVKWYLHWRRYHQKELGKSVRTINIEFGVLVHELADGEIAPPDGFDVAWFRKAAGRVNKGDKESFVSDLPNALKRAWGHPRRDALLSSDPNEDPKIPPVDRAAYGSRNPK